MELKAYRIERLKAAAAAAGADMIVATLPANLNYITTGYVCINQDVLTRAECAIGYIPSKDKYVYIVGYADLPTILEFAGNDAEVYFAGGGFFFEKGAENDEFFLAVEFHRQDRSVELFLTQSVENRIVFELDRRSGFLAAVNNTRQLVRAAKAAARTRTLHVTRGGDDFHWMTPKDKKKVPAVATNGGTGLKK